MENLQWQSLVKLGNECFHEKQWQQAEFFYSEAYDLLAFGYRNNPLCEETLMAWICTCQNLSSLYEVVGKLDLSLKFLTVPHEYLQSVTTTPKVGEDIKVLAIKGLSLTLPPILEFAKQHPICGDCLEKFRAQDTLQNFHSTVVH